MKKIVAIVMAMLMVMSVMATVAFAGGAADKDTEPKVPVIIGIKDTPSQADKDMIRGHGGDIKHSYTIINAIAAKLPEQAIDSIKKNPRVRYVELDHEVHTLQETLPWGVDRIDADLVWDYNKGTGVNVCIIDTGIDYTHPDLDANYKGGYDFVNNDADPKDDNGHGTHCAGIAAAENNTIGVVGVAPEANLYAVKVLNSLGSGYLSDCIEGIEWSVANGMQVISMSWGSSTYSASLETACNNAYNAGLVLVAAAGNSGDGNPATNEYSYPAAYGSVIAVGATDKTDVAPYWSNSGPYLELAAPGVSIYSTLPTYRVTLTRTYGYNYGTLSGTSMACPHVAGTAALVIASDPTLTNVAVRSRLNTAADDLGPAGRDTVYGYGLMDADEAAPAPSVPNTPPVADADGPYGGTEDVVVTFNGSGSYDLDGDPLAYAWDFGDGSTGTGVNPTHVYTAGGTYTVTLVVNDGKVDSEPSTTTATIAEVNDPPEADAGPDQTVVVGEVVTFDGSGSSDIDGYITAYSWDFGDGNIGTGVTTTHNYTTTGTYTVTLTVSDNAGANDTDTSIVTVTEAPANLMHVASIGMRYTRVGRNYNIYTTVKIVDSGNVSVDGATVDLKTTLPTGGSTASGSGVTGADGTVTFVYGPTRLRGTYTSTVTDVAKTDWTYTPAANVETSETLTVP